MNSEQFQEAYRKLAAKNYLAYLLYTVKGFKRYRHSVLIAEKLQEIIDGTPKKLIISMPPRHGKSLVTAETFASFFLGNFPDKKVIATAYGGGLANKFGDKNKAKFAKYGPELWGLEVDYNNKGKSAWQVKEHEGRMVAAGIMGGITGEGADLMIIDDPYKNRQAADSRTIREGIWEEWQNTLSTRLHAGGSVIIIHTRWREDDLSGTLLQQAPDEWEVLSLPLIADEEDDLLGREIGQALCPELGYDEEWARLKKLDVGSKAFASLYQQKPAPDTGEVFKREWLNKRWTALPQFEKQIISMDATFKGTDTSDYVVMQCWGKKDAEYFLIDQVRAKMDFTTTLTTFKSFCAKHPRAITKLIEDKANGTAIINTLQKTVGGIVPINPRESKEARAQAIAPLFEAGNVYLPNESWVGDLIEEFVVFPSGKHDDQLDSTSQALNYFSSNSGKKAKLKIY